MLETGSFRMYHELHSSIETPRFRFGPAGGPIGRWRPAPAPHVAAVRLGPAAQGASAESVQEGEQFFWENNPWTKAVHKEKHWYKNHKSS